MKAKFLVYKFEYKCTSYFYSGKSYVDVVILLEIDVQISKHVFTLRKKLNRLTNQRGKIIWESQMLEVRPEEMMLTVQETIQ